MYASPLFRFLRALKAKEWNKFQKFVEKNLDNPQSVNTLLLFKFICSKKVSIHDENLSNEKFMAELRKHSKNEYDPKHYQNNAKVIAKLLDEFLMQQELKQSSAFQLMLRASYLAERPEARQWVQKKQSEFERQLKKKSPHLEEDYLALAYINHKRFVLQGKAMSPAEAAIFHKDTLRNFEHLRTLIYLRHKLELQFNHKVDGHLLDSPILHSDSFIDTTHIGEPVQSNVLIYKQLLRALDAEELEVEEFEQSCQAFDQIALELNNNEQRRLAVYLINLAAKNLNLGNTLYRDAMLKYQIKWLADEILLDDGLIPEETYLNVIDNLVASKRFEEALQFREDYGKIMIPDRRERSMWMGLLIIQFHQKRFKECLDMIVRESPEAMKPLYKLRVRILEFRSAFALYLANHDYDNYHHFYDRYRQFLTKQRKKDFGEEVRVPFVTLKDFLHKIVLAYQKGPYFLTKDQKQDFIEQLATKNILGKSWVRMMLDQIKVK